MSLVLGEDSNEFGDGCAQILESGATRQAFDGRCRLGEGENACAESVSLKWGSLDDGWELRVRTIRLAVTGAVWSESREMQIALRRRVLVARAAMMNELDGAPVGWRENEKWLVLKKRAQTAAPRRILLRGAGKSRTAK